MTATRPAGAPEAHVVDVQQPGRLVECAQLARQAAFQQLVRQYLAQILHGCKSAYCTTPSCLSSARRNAARPSRPPTQLTARILAHHLASQDNPRRGLCPHELKVLPGAVEVERGGHVGVSTRQRSRRAGSDYVVYPPIWRGSRADDAALVEAVTAQHQAKKDVKSLGQNLYDTATVISSYSKQLPTPASVFALLRTPDHAPDRKANTPAEAPHANKQPPIRSVKDTSRIARQHSQHNLRQSAPELLSNGQQLHKIPYQPPTTSSPGKQTKSKTSPDMDGILETPRLVREQTGKQSIANGGKGQLLTAVPKHTETIKSSVSQTALLLPVAPILNCDLLDKLKDSVCHHRKNTSNHFDFAVDYDANRPFRRAQPFVNRSLFYTLGDPEALLKSFHECNEAFSDSPLPHLDSSRLTHSFRDWDRQNGALIFDSLWIAVEALFTPPPQLNLQTTPRQRPSSGSAQGDSVPRDPSSHDKADNPSPRYLSNHEAAHIVLICIHALTSLVSCGWTHTWAQLRKLRSWGIVIPNAAPNTDAFSHPYLNIIDELEYEPAIRLADRLLRGIGARTCFERILASLNRTQNPPKDDEKDDMHSLYDPPLVEIIIKHLQVVEHNALAKKREMGSGHSSSDDPGWTVTATFMEWLRTVIMKKWDSKAEINKWGSVGTAILLLDRFHVEWKVLNLRPSMFEMPLFNERLDIVEEPLKFLDWSCQPNTVHILEFPNLFSLQHLVAYFRTINFTSMMLEYETTARVHQMQRSLDMFLREPYWWVIKYRMKVALSDYLVLDVSREDPLKDTLDQLYGLEKKMLKKPLKVKMGQHEGEVGLDHGGVTYEFFRTVLSEAFKPDNGMFTIDPQSRMTWFQPGTLEPDWKFEMLGILFSLALYNGITLPVTFPLALYHHLLNPFGVITRILTHREAEPGMLDFIQDGWPGLAKAFSHLLEWSDGDVEDVMMREYAFSYEVFGQRIDHDMRRPFGRGTQEKGNAGLHDSESEKGETPMVTNANRKQFVQEYIFYLTLISVEPQLEAFLRGFRVCINEKSLNFFTPSTLRDLVEGIQHISITDLQRCAKYEDGYSATHQIITDFWSIAEQYSQEDRRRLLEFVTASDRVPITGYESITFHIVRSGGESENLPTSSTCFGKLYLPEYGDKKTLQRKLDLAIQNSQGFGVV